MFAGSLYFDKRVTGITSGGINPATINHGANFEVTVGGKKTVVKELDGLIQLPLTLNGPLQITLKRAAVGAK